MRTLVVAVVGALLLSAQGQATGPKRKPLNPREREAIIALMKAVDHAQDTDVVADDGVAFDHHVLKSIDELAYVPFRLTLDQTVDLKAATAMYVRAVSRHDGLRSAQEHSYLREWVTRGGDLMPRNGETVFLGAGEMPIGGPAIASSRQSTAAAAQASAALAMRQREYERQRAENEDARKREESKTRDPFLFPFEEYYFFDLKSPRTVERALSLPPGEYDLFIGLVAPPRVKTSSPVVLRRTVAVPDLSAQMSLSSLILAKDVRQLPAPLSRDQQVEHPYTFGVAEVLPVTEPAFSVVDALTVVFQVCNYGAPDADLVANYEFFRTDGTRRLFNRTSPQELHDADLPKPGTWDTTAFVSQTVPLAPFPPGSYELEVSVRDRLTRASAKGSVAFTVGSGVR